jgi:ribosomal-protein-alanine N-acetyltransferase
LDSGGADRQDADVSASWPGELTVRPLTTVDAEQIAQWRYEGPWQVYDPRPEDGLLSEQGGYLAVAGVPGGPLIGFCCSGAEARVPALTAHEGLLDVGVGMDPAWAGRGHGADFGRAVLEHYRRQTGVWRLRAVVQAWNERSLRLTRSLGFHEVGEHVCERDGKLVTYKIVVAD